MEFECLNVHSIYLFKENDNQQPVINLSPFYFDYNSGEPKATKIHLSVLKFYSEKDGSFYFNSISEDDVFSKDRPKIFPIEGNNQPSPVYDFKFNTQKIYKQLMYFVEKLNHG